MLRILHEEQRFLVVLKPAGILTHSTGRGEEKALADFVAEKYPEIKKVGDVPTLRPGVVHRLDKDTSGIILFARTQDFFEYLKKCFQEGKIEKTYMALVWGKTKPKGIIDAPIGLKSGSVKRSVLAKKMKMVKPAITEYETLKHFIFEGNDFSLVRVHPKTGRTHQIRVHMAHIGHGLVGDPLYMKRKDPFHAKGQMLHAESVAFPLPEGGKARFEAPIGGDFARILEILTNK